ncbi:predicted protein [Sclerotinia sclerotiorum 1980 UF-70]|uniref:Uncharacterized protein n=1 Tax=Sclerotinia sclerotiorum (strain ATCC 18683 / 1980 / Ss-1) TaxID=665079 RepID=A7EUK3_SCLS1|nr:predicted protein [Sclerotinia sclerotiorum 1980 UF-70]EDN93145.1 predicted protein [Sclerotinia sclerotiorum 1980 UF-70]
MPQILLVGSGGTVAYARLRYIPYHPSILPQVRHGTSRIALRVVWFRYLRNECLVKT